MATNEQLFTALRGSLSDEGARVLEKNYEPRKALLKPKPVKMPKIQPEPVELAMLDDGGGGSSSMAPAKGRTAISRKARTATPEPRLRFSSQSYETMYAIITDTYNDSLRLRGEVARQARGSFNISVGMFVLGGVVILGGATMIALGKNLVGALSSVVGVIFEVAGARVMKLRRECMAELRRKDADLDKLNRAKVQYALLLEIKDEQKRNDILQELIRSVNGSKPRSAAS